jgi:hypothetical protein
MKAVFTLCSNNYLGQAIVLGKSFLKFHPEADFIVGLVDRLDASIDYNALEPIQILPFEKLPFAQFEQMRNSYDIIEFNTAVKPFYFEYLFNTKYDKVIYLDPDIAVFSSLNELFDLLDANDILVTPHTITPTHAFDSKWQKVQNLVGMYNFGFLALAKTENTFSLLYWWQKKLETECRMWPAEGLFVDQIWGNYFPIFFEKSYIIKDPGYNMAYWNFGERKLDYTNGQYWANNSLLKFFHFSNIKFGEKDVISGYSDYTFTERPDLVEIYNWYFNELTENGYLKYKQLKPSIHFRNNNEGLRKETGKKIKFHGTKLINTITKHLFGV